MPVRHKLTLLIVTGNLIGAILTYLYFSTIRANEPLAAGVPSFYGHLFFGIGTALLIFTFVSLTRLRSSYIFRIADNIISIKEVDDDTARKLKKDAIQFPSLTAGVTFLVWIIAGFIFGLLEPVITQALWGVKPPDLAECLRRFFGIVCLGGSVTALIIYFTTESVWRKSIPKFFPEGDLSHVPDAFKLNVKIRLLIVFLMISLVPLPILGITAYSKAQALHTADAIVRTQIMSSLRVEIIFITAIAVAVSLILSLFVSRSVSGPLKSLENAIKEVEGDNLDVSVEIVSNDEIGAVAEGFNRMVRGVERIRINKGIIWEISQPGDTR